MLSGTGGLELILRGPIRTFRIEETGSFGAGLSPFLQARGHNAIEVNRPNRQLRYQHGKNDPLDAQSRRVRSVNLCGFDILLNPRNGRRIQQVGQALDRLDHQISQLPRLRRNRRIGHFLACLPALQTL
jgi:transposase